MNYHLASNCQHEASATSVNIRSPDNVVCLLLSTCQHVLYYVHVSAEHFCWKILCHRNMQMPLMTLFQHN